MKRFWSVTMILLLLVALSACGQAAVDPTAAPAPSDDGTPASTGAPTTTTTTAASPAADTPTTFTPTVQTISRDRAVEIALQTAGLARDQVFDLDAELDRERGELYWEVDFETREYEYSYDILAEDGAVARSHKEPND